MNDENDPWKAGHQNRQWQYGMDSSQFNAGREQREREEAERQRQWRENAERNAAGNNSTSTAPSWGGQSGWSPGTSTGGGEGGGLALLILLGGAGAVWLVWTFMYVLLGVTLGIAVVTGVTGTALWGAVTLAGGRIGWWEAVKQGAIAMLIVAAVIVAFVLLSGLSVSNGGPELVPGLGPVLTAPSAETLSLVGRTATFGLVLLAAAGIAVGTWRLHKALPVTPKLKRPARWAVLAVLLLIVPAAGIWLAVKLWAMASPLPVGPLLGNVQLLVSLAAAIGAGTLLAALVGGGANAILRKRGWRVSTRGYAAGQAAKGFLAYALSLLLLGIMYRAGDGLLIGMGQMISPWPNAAGVTQSNVLSGLPGFLLLQLAPFGLFVAIVRETQHEPGVVDRLRLLAIAQALVLAIALIAILIFWATAFALAR